MIAMVRQLPSVLLMALFVFSSAMAAEKSEDFEYGPQPPEAVFDPSGFLDPKVAKEISDPLSKISAEQNIDVVVVILPDLEGAPPEHVAGRFAAAWCDAPIHAVVLHVPGHPDAPWLVPAGKLMGFIKPEVVAQSVADAERRASLEVSEPAKVRAAANEAADMLRYWMANAINRSQEIQAAVTGIRAEQEAAALRWRIAAMTASAAAIPLLVGISLLAYWVRKRGKPRTFPLPAYSRRLGAPHAGGNHAVLLLQRDRRD